MAPATKANSSGKKELSDVAPVDDLDSVKSFQNPAGNNSVTPNFRIRSYANKFQNKDDDEIEIQDINKEYPDDEERYELETTNVSTPCLCSVSPSLVECQNTVMPTQPKLEKEEDDSKIQPATEQLLSHNPKIKKAVGGTDTGKTCNNDCVKKCAVSSTANPGSTNMASNNGLGGGGGDNGGDKNDNPTADTINAEVSVTKDENEQEKNNLKEHLKINRYNSGKCRHCSECKEIARKMEDFLYKGILDWLPVVEYHKNVCKFKKHCKVCCRLKENELKLQILKDLQMKMSSENLIIWKEDKFYDLCYFIENHHFYFGADKYFKKGGFGEVYHIELPQSLKERYFGSSCPKLVLKKAIVKEDEMYVLRKTSSHPNFVRCLLLVQKKDGNFTHRIVMIKCEKNLKEYVKQLRRDGKTLSKAEAVFYWHQVVEAVSYLHHHLPVPVIHKDIKGSNVLMTIENNMIRVKLADFGLAMCLHNEYTASGLPAAGTRGFKAPEVEQCLPHGRPADIYSLAVLLLEMLFEKWKNKKRAVERLKDLDQDLGQLIERCLSEDVKERPRAVDILHSCALEKYLPFQIDFRDAKNRLQSDV